MLTENFVLVVQINAEFKRITTLPLQSRFLSQLDILSGSGEFSPQTFPAITWIFISKPDLPPHPDRPALPPLTSLGFWIHADVAHPSPGYPPKLWISAPTTQPRSCAQHHRHVWRCTFSSP
uniref:Uncharacterized protein n=2 Tax=Nothobranchius kadleci TaxID=1051664 RepID=A0A1A8CKM6_NOTKA